MRSLLLAGVAVLTGSATPPQPERPASSCRVLKADRSGAEELRCRPLKPGRPSAAQQHLPGLY